MKRTTLALEEELQRTLKAKAASEGRTLQDLVNEMLKHGLVERAPADYRLVLEGWQCEIQPGVDVIDRDKLFDLMSKN